MSATSPPMVTQSEAQPFCPGSQQPFDFAGAALPPMPIADMSITAIDAQRSCAADAAIGAKVKPSITNSDSSQRRMFGYGHDLLALSIGQCGAALPAAPVLQRYEGCGAPLRKKNATLIREWSRAGRREDERHAAVLFDERAA